MTQIRFPAGAVPRSRRAGFFSVGLISLSLIAALIVSSTLEPTRGLSASSQKLQAPPTDIRVNQVATADQQEPALAVNPTNANNVLSAAKDWRTGPKQVWYYRSTDGGNTWADGHVDFPSELPNQSDPCVTFDASGTAYMSVLGYNQNDFSIGGAYVTRSTDGGATWQKPVVVSTNSNEIFNDKEWITADLSNNSATKGNIYISWTLFTQQGTHSERGDIVVSRSTDGGTTFSPHVVASLPNQTQNQGSFPAIGPNGEVYVLYYSGIEGADKEDGRGGDGGGSGSGGGEGQGGGQMQAQLAEDTALFVARSTDGGQTFPQVKRAATVQRPPSPLPGSNFRMFVLPTLAVDPRNGTLYATWNDYAVGDADVMLVKSEDGGQSWSQPLRVNDDPSTPHHDQFFPTAKVGSDGTLHMLWLDRRDDAGNLRYEPYYARSTDGGISFSKNAPVSHVPSNPNVGFQGTIIGDYVGLDVSADGSNVYTAWPDTRSGDQDIYFTQFPAQNGPPEQAQVSDAISPTPVAVPSPQPLTGFTDEAFLHTWERADRPVATGKASRPWLWGPVSFAAAKEPYTQGSDGTRDVQYFDKARMEINNPRGDRSSQFYVTNGLLVVELISGRVQLGDQQFEPEPRPPSQVPVAGDVNSPDALTYASLASVASLNNDKRAPDRTGQSVIAALDKSGQARDDPSRGNLVRITRYESILGHNIPDVFWNFMNSTGPVYNDRLKNYSDAPILNWITDLGYPITEPYWTSVRINGAPKWVLVQAFQRRVLTYVPDNASGWQVEMGNVGRHYYDWRYK